MGDPVPGTPAWFRKLERNRARAQAVRDARFCAGSRGQSILAKDRREQAARGNAEADSLRARSNRNMRAAHGHARQAARATSELKHVKKQLLKEGNEKRALQTALTKALAAQKKAEAAQKKTEKDLQQLRFKWDWLFLKVSEREARRLRRLSSTPPRNRDRSWGGGQ